MWRFWVSIGIGLSVILFLIYWLWVFAEPFDIYQNLAIFIVTLLIAGGLVAAIWILRGMRYDSGHDHHHEGDDKK
jgi:hypothetical protein